jgi:hypothetical protein
MIDLLKQEDRLAILASIRTEENKQRKAASLKQFEIYSDRLTQYVKEYLESQFSKNTVKQMPLVSSINIAKKIVNQEASIYKHDVSREFIGADEREEEVLYTLYNEMNFNSKMLKANQVFKLQNQALLMIVPKNGQLIARVLMGHHYDVVLDPEDSITPIGYIVSAFDKDLYIKTTYGDKQNQPIGDEDDYKSILERYVVWTKDYNFIMDGNGKILTEDIVSPLADYQIMPFVDISIEKDFEYFVRLGQSLTDFTVQYNAAMSDLGNVVRIQGWSQAVFKGPKELIPENLHIGPNLILKLPTDNTNAADVDFSFVSPSPDIDGSIKYVEMLLSNFLTTHGVDPSTVLSGSQKFTSGIERLLSMIDKFEASKSDFSLFKDVEFKCFDIVKAWCNTYAGTDVLYSAQAVSDDIKLSVKYSEPQMIQSRQEKIESIAREMELGLKSRKDAIKELYGFNDEAALSKIEEIDEVTSDVQDTGA